MDLSKYFSRIDKTKIAPWFWSKCEELIKNCIIRGSSYYAISGYRSPEEQAKLYAKGRTEPGSIVSNAVPYKSYHNYGLAIDFCWDANIQREGLQPGWESKSYVVLYEEAKKLGLITGLKFKNVDAPHTQVPIHIVGLKKLEDIYKTTKELQKCWDYALENLKKAVDTKKLYENY